MGVCSPFPNTFLRAGRANPGARDARRSLKKYRTHLHAQNDRAGRAQENRRKNMIEGSAFSTYVTTAGSKPRSRNRLDPLCPMKFSPRNVARSTKGPGICFFKTAQGFSKRRPGDTERGRGAAWIGAAATPHWASRPAKGGARVGATIAAGAPTTQRVHLPGLATGRLPRDAAARARRVRDPRRLRRGTSPRRFPREAAARGAALHGCGRDRALAPLGERSPIGHDRAVETHQKPMASTGEAMADEPAPHAVLCPTQPLAACHSAPRAAILAHATRCEYVARFCEP